MAGSAVTIGTFDGVHSGHRKVIEVLREVAASRGLRAVLVTFDRHPLEVVNPSKAPRLLMTTDDRDAMLGSMGIDVERIAFTEQLRSLTARAWMGRLKREFDCKVLLLGYDNRFGSDGRSMKFEDFKRIGDDLGIEVVRAEDLPGCSSSEVRRALSQGDMKKSAKILGRDWQISGTVGKGQQIGRAIGFPTANIEFDIRLQIPPRGVYAAIADVEGKEWPAAVNIGCRPTIGDGLKETIEAYLIGFEGDLYGKRITLKFKERIRGEEKFANLEALRRRIEVDVELAKKYAK